MIKFDPSAEHDSRLACSAAEFGILKTALTALVAAGGADMFARHLEAIKLEGKARDPITRVRWDSFWAARKRFPINPETGSPSAFHDSRDTHIDSALRRLLPESGE